MALASTVKTDGFLVFVFVLLVAFVFVLVLLIALIFVLLVAFW